MNTESIPSSVNSSSVDVAGETAAVDDNPITSIDLVVVSADDIINTLQQNEEYSTPRNPYGMHITPPFNERMSVDTYSTDGNEIRTSPVSGAIEILPAAFLTGVNDTDFEAIPDGCVYPSKLDQRKEFREEYGYTDDSGSPIELSPEQMADWESWWQRTIADWKGDVRNNLVDEVIINKTKSASERENNTIKVRYE